MLKQNWSDVVWFIPTHESLNHHGKEPSEITSSKPNENLTHSIPNKLGKVTLDAKQDTIYWKLTKDGSTFNHDDHTNVFTKSKKMHTNVGNSGILKPDHSYQILNIFYDKNFTPSL